MKMKLKKKPSVHSVWTGVLSAGFAGAEAIVPLLSVTIPKGAFIVLSGVTAVASVLVHIFKADDNG